MNTIDYVTNTLNRNIEHRVGISIRLDREARWFGWMSTACLAVFVLAELLSITGGGIFAAAGLWAGLKYTYIKSRARSSHDTATCLAVVSETLSNKDKVIL